MTALFAHEPVPKAAIRTGMAIVVLAIVCAALGRYTDLGTTHVPPSPVVESRDLRFADVADGSVLITDARDNATVAVLAPGTNGFVRGTMRGLARDRRMRNIGAEPPFTLARRADGRLSLIDPTSGRHIELYGFGQTNFVAFAKLMPTGGARS